MSNPDGRQGFADRSGREWRPYLEARRFVRHLGIRSVKNWRAYTHGKISGMPDLPPDIPINPHYIYRNQWQGYPDWLGKSWRSFEKAREFARGLGLHSVEEWWAYIRDELPDKPPLPSDIPKHPHAAYADSGWRGYPDWLDRNWRPIKWRPFRQARAFARRLDLKSFEEWVKYAGGSLPGREPKPEDIPSCPDKTYKTRGWNGWADWLGKQSRRIGRRGKRGPQIQYRSFENARAFVWSLSLKSTAEWWTYCRGGLPKKVGKPDDIPTNPHRIYKDRGWRNYSDWLGKIKERRPGVRLGRDSAVAPREAKTLTPARYPEIVRPPILLGKIFTGRAVLPDH